MRLCFKLKDFQKKTEGEADRWGRILQELRGEFMSLQEKPRCREDGSEKAAGTGGSLGEKLSVVSFSVTAGE